ncbi:hypothetical protein ACFB49_42420 [Sphingomonas sp. DBB INV C78]|uniref:hypothetical protein n=1 Tax=Sphingomonas sp. DBB INV C78 TaxID=3349434 RepID=UPI0036D34A28
MTDREAAEILEAAEQDRASMAEEKAATSAPIGISSRQIFAIAILAIGSWMIISGWILLTDASEAERAGIQKAAETIATAAFFFYLGSSASSRNKDHRP